MYYGLQRRLSECAVLRALTAVVKYRTPHFSGATIRLPLIPDYPRCMQLSKIYGGGKRSRADGIDQLDSRVLLKRLIIQVASAKPQGPLTAKIIRGDQ